MSQPLLSASHSINLEKLLSVQPDLVQGIEFTPYTPLTSLPETCHRLSKNYQLFFHPGHWLRYPLVSKKMRQDLQQYLTTIQPSFVSFHIYLKPAWVVWLAQHNIYFPLKRNPAVESNLITKINSLKEKLFCPILLENMPSAGLKDRRECDPQIIKTIVRETGAAFLLDIPHAIISAQMLGMPVEEYLNALPLEQTQEVHISGMRSKNGFYYDAHETIGEEEKYWLKWLLDHTNPHLINLEYYQDLANLTTQLEDLAKILGY